VISVTYGRDGAAPPGAAPPRRRPRAGRDVAGDGAAPVLVAPGDHHRMRRTRGHADAAWAGDPARAARILRAHELFDAVDQRAEATRPQPRSWLAASRGGR
jgi:hypothetical protein